MKRRTVLSLAALAAMIALAAMSLREEKKGNLLLLEWANKGPSTKPPIAVLVEIGLKDTEPTKYALRAAVSGAKVVHREGYRFRDDDKLTDPDGLDVSSHRGLRVPPRQPAVARQEGIATVGLVLHLSDIKDDATLTLEPKDKGPDKVTVPLKKVLDGQAQHVWDGGASVRLISTATPLTSGKTEDDFPAAAYGPDGTLWVAYVSYTLRDEGRRVEQKAFQKEPENFKALFHPEFADQVFVKYLRDGKWSEPIAITDNKQDIVRCAVAVEGDGTAWVIYTANREGRHDLFARSLSPGKGEGKGATLNPEKLIVRGNTLALNPVACTDKAGRVRVFYQVVQQSRQGTSNITQINCVNGKWGDVSSVGWGTDPGMSWCPATAAGPGGEVALAFDGYRDGDYDVFGITLEGLGRTSTNIMVASSSRFETRPSACYDAKGRLWIAYEEGPEQWGKDYGSLVPDKGSPLYNERSVRVVCLQDGKLFKPAAELPTSKVRAPIAGVPETTQGYEKATRYAYPRLGLDGKGRLWLTYREKFGSRYTTHPGSYWLTFARRLDGDHWTEPIEIHHSDGLLDSRPAMLPHASGGLLVVHNTDGRYTTPNEVQNRLYTSFVDLPGDPVEPKLVAHDPGKKDPKLVERAKEEAEAVRRMRDYRIEAGGKKYQLLRGEYHRHTEISWDGGPDGSLEDMFRYAIDAAAMDWIGNGDHDSGAGREYAWWLIQKFSDAYHVKDRFTPMFTYERSVNYPHGHRNCMFAKRGILTLPRLAEMDQDKRVGGVHADDTKMLYRYLKEHDGICAVHTSATSMGTDWRDNDPQVEPIVEIYQGDRMSYEREDAPRAGYPADSGKKPVNIAGWYPKGFINNALEKGYRLGFQSSSDHWSTHISYFVVLAEKHDRESILAAVKQRHCYGATHDIVLDVRSGGHLMGDAFKADAAPALQINVVGTGDLAKVEILKDSDVVETIQPGKRQYKGEWTDPKPSAGTHYYYVRVQQADGELAWSSPMWIERAK
jgi:hypothetical protein